MSDWKYTHFSLWLFIVVCCKIYLTQMLNMQMNCFIFLNREVQLTILTAYVLSFSSSYITVFLFIVFLKHRKRHAKWLPLCMKCSTQIQLPYLVLSSFLVHIFYLFSHFLSFIVSLFSCNFTIETSVFTSCLPFKKSLFILHSAGVWLSYYHSAGNTMGRVPVAANHKPKLGGEGHFSYKSWNMAVGEQP